MLEEKYKEEGERKDYEKEVKQRTTKEMKQKRTQNQPENIFLVNYYYY